MACGSPAPDLDRLNRAFDESVRLFAEYRLPNSMARPAGFDLESHLREVEAKRENVSSVFHSPSGVQFIQARIQAEPDELVVLAGLEILYESKSRSAVPTFERFSRASSPVVAEWASRYLEESTTWP